MYLQNAIKIHHFLEKNINKKKSERFYFTSGWIRYDRA